MPSGGTLTFACYRGSATTLTSNPQNYQQITAYSKKYLPISSYPKKYQDFSATKNINNAEHTEMPKLLVVFRKYDLKHLLSINQKITVLYIKETP